MLRNLAIAIVQAAFLLPLTSTSVPAAQAEFGTEKEARSMLERAVVALKENKEKAFLGSFRANRANPEYLRTQFHRTLRVTFPLFLEERMNLVREKAPFPVRFPTRRLTCNE